MWREQWDRVGRWYGAFRHTNDGRPHDRDSDYYVDEVYAFFQNCYAFKDWLKNDPATRHITSDVEAVIDGSPNLCLCGDLANGTKHLRLTSTRTGDPATSFSGRDYALTLGEPPTVTARLRIESGGLARDAFEVATECMAEWERYLTGKGLL